MFSASLFFSSHALQGNAIAENGETSGSSGLAVAILMLVAGIVGLCTRKSKGGGITTGVFYAVAGLVGISNYGSYSDLMVWAILCFVFAAVFIIGSVTMKTQNKATENEERQ